MDIEVYHEWKETAKLECNLLFVKLYINYYI